MTLDEYAGRRAADEVERVRIRGILDQHAARKALGSQTGDDAPLIRKTLKELDDVTRKALELEKEFWAEFYGLTDA